MTETGEREYWVIQGNYAPGGWEDLSRYRNDRAAWRNLKKYKRTSSTTPFRVIQRFEKAEKS